jgi:GNAT superfamily N-acetyltransferase
MQQAVSLSFGVVHPHHQRKGIGTALLLARIAILPKPQDFYCVSMSPLPNAQPFFRKFGFGFVASYNDRDSQLVFDLFAVQVYLRQWKQAGDLLRRSGIKLDIQNPIPAMVSSSDASHVPWQVVPFTGFQNIRRP